MTMDEEYEVLIKRLDEEIIEASVSANDCEAVAGNNLLDSVTGLSDTEAGAAALPWTAKSYRLWSLFDMLRFYAGPYTHIVRALGGMRAWFSTKENDPKVALGLFQVMMLAMKPDVAELPISSSLQEQFDRLLRYVDYSDGTVEANDKLGTYLQELLENLKFEMSSVCFLKVSAECQHLYEQGEPLLGVAVAKRFSAANDDIAAAGRCLAVGEWDAGVFHLMRVLEHGLRAFVRNKLRVSGVNIMEWRELIQAIESKRKEIANQPKSPKRDAKLEYLSERAVNFNHFKDAWRNYVSHGRKSYGEHQAMTIYSHVRTFIRATAWTAMEAISEREEDGRYIATIRLPFDKPDGVVA